MTMTDPISDMLTRIRNAQAVGKKQVSMPGSKVKESIAKVLLDEGYIAGYSSEAEGNKGILLVVLKYFEGKPVIATIKRASRPGLRLYKNRHELPDVMNGLGVAIVSTSGGVMTTKAARAAGLGGEVMCYVS
ncbi:MAG: 30S ribosomal protein S8 [Gammaproteobacteria bacterium]|nr:30S ribosomal protein S8 [Gammaproteobacteria bacterium]